MLERLARWLRVLGYDVASAHLSGPEAATYLSQAATQGRVILSRNPKLAIPGLEGDALFVESRSPLAQLGEVITRLQLRGPWRLFTRCLLCNTPLGPAPVSADTPAGAQHCPSCGRRYWEGVHTRRMRAALRRGLGSAFAEVTG
jgi:uncharacterized protein with PIN domain